MDILRFEILTVVTMMTKYLLRDNEAVQSGRS
jgi:hypothetical protein